MADSAHRGNETGPVNLAEEQDFFLGEIAVRPSACEIELERVVHRIEPRLMQVLVALAGAGGRVLSRDALIDGCWAGAIVTDDAINRVIGRLRRVAALAPGKAFRIDTIPKIGYRLTADAAVPPPLAATATTPDPAPSGSARYGGVNRPVVVTAIALGLAVVTVITVVTLPVMFGFGRDRDERVAVLDFTTSSPQLGAYSAALAERIRAQLSESELQTIAHATAEDFRGPQLVMAAKDIRVAFVLDGALRAEDGVLHVDIKLVDARENLALWSKDYERVEKEGDALQEQVAAHAADVLRCALVSRRPGSGEIAPQTLAVFLRACDQINRFDGAPNDMLESARRVTKEAPRFSRGWSMLAMAAAYASRSAPSAERAEAFRAQTRQAAARALELDSANAEALLAQSVALPLLGAWTERQGLLDQAFSLGPIQPEADLLQAELLSEQGRLAEALEFLRQAVAADPLAPNFRAPMVPVLGGLGRFEEMAEVRDHLYAVWPNSPSARFNRFHNFAYVDDPAVALKMLDTRTIVLDEPSASAWRAFLEAKTSDGHFGLHVSVLKVVALAQDGQFDRPGAIAMAASVGETDLAFMLADHYFSGPLGALRVNQPASGAGGYFLFVPATKSLRRDPRFMTLANRMGLAELWRETDRWPDFCSEPDLPYDCEAAAAVQ